MSIAHGLHGQNRGLCLQLTLHDAPAVVLLHVRQQGSEGTTHLRRPQGFAPERKGGLQGEAIVPVLSPAP